MGYPSRIALIALTACSVASAQAVEADTRPATQPSRDYSLTIYSTADPATFDPQGNERMARYYGRQQQPLPGYGVVRQTRRFDFKQGVNTLRVTDVASGIDATTVKFESLTDPGGASVLEQNYEYDVASAEKILEKYLGKRVIITRKPAGASTQYETIQGTLLASEDYQSIVLQRGDDVQILQRSDLSDVRLTKAQTGLVTKPTLVWNVEAEKAGAHDARITYQTDGLTWRADYTVIVSKDDTKADIGAWVSILNASGASYPDAKLKLVAGDVQRLQPPEMAQQSMFGGGGGGYREKGGGFVEKSFFEYHLYTLGRSTSLANNSTKQIELFPTRGNVPVNKTFVYYGLAPEYRLWHWDNEPNQDRNLGTQSNKQVDIYLKMKNSEQNGLGIPLPAGRLRVYKQDEADQLNEFVGEDVISHTPKDEEVLIKLGSAFDIVGERKQTNFTVDSDGHVIAESFEIVLRNHKKEPVDVIVKENLFRWMNWEITANSDKWEKQDFRTIHIPVQVAPDGEKKVTYTVKYTW